MNEIQAPSGAASAGIYRAYGAGVFLTDDSTKMPRLRRFGGRNIFGQRALPPRPRGDGVLTKKYSITHRLPNFGTKAWNHEFPNPVNLREKKIHVVFSGRIIGVFSAT